MKLPELEIFQIPQMVFRIILPETSGAVYGAAFIHHKVLLGKDILPP